MKNKVILFNKKEDCCACGACFNICPKNAIEMVTDEYGFKYPKINDKKCINCNACKRVCAYQYVEEKNRPIAVFVSARKDSEKIMKSASGGIFATLAEKVLNEKGIVFGSALVEENNVLEIKHIYIDRLKDLSKLVGSKYVQSDINIAYKKAKMFLTEGRKVLFSGTPCQVAGLKSFLGKSYNNLLTMDIICHGVPNADFFRDYLKVLEKNFKGKVIDFKFRDKKYGWGLNSCLKYKKDNSILYKYFLVDESTYYHMFLNAECYRENCYRCKYTNKNRTGDITIGDYWGIENEHPELLKENGGKLDKYKGISAVIVNTENGKFWFNKCRNELYMYPSTFEQVAKANTQLRQPSSYGKFRDKIMQIYKENGYEAVDKFYYNKIIKKILLKKSLKEKIKNLLPEIVWIKLKLIYKKLKYKGSE